MILLMGSEGSMGKRYQAILDHLDKPYLKMDVATNKCVLEDDWQKIDGVILATPTETHPRLIKDLARPNRPVLCEKPICKSLSDLEETLYWTRENGSKLTMMMQYQVFDKPYYNGHTFYNYYNTGKDGLNWDCIQIIGLARTTVSIKNDSPIWECQLNGKTIDRSAMDWAYVHFVKEWLQGFIKQDHNWLMDIHHKASEWKKS